MEESSEYEVKSGVIQGLTGIAFLGDRDVCVQDIFELRAQELGRCSERVAVLAKSPLVLSNMDLLVVDGSKCRPLKQVVNITGSLDLGRVKD